MPPPSRTTVARAPGVHPAPASSPIVASEGAINGTREALARSPEPGPVALAAETANDMVSVSPGFRPDPIVRRGTAGGPVRAADLDASCPGYISQTPSYLLKVDAPISDLRILVHMAGDATLLVQLEDGRYLCNDDYEGLNPVIEGPMPPGRHRIWVGTYGQSDVGLHYTIAFTRQLTLRTGQLESMATTP